MKKPALKFSPIAIILFRILLSLMVPSVIGGIGLTYIGLRFWEGFSICLFATWIAGYISNDIVNHKAAKDILKLQKQKVQYENSQNVELSCAYCHKPNMVPIWLSKKNLFACTHCKETNLVIFQYTTAQVTTPIDVPKIEPPQSH